ncbi:hypothetical protein JL721_12999 [Aureococcus anophagefferens]|nr:hypothetical protein JL721_12999 [Aureococcus anophagefferens]
MAAWWRTLVLVAAAAADRQVASIGAYPGYTGDIAVSGVVVISETDGGIEMTGTLTGLEASVTGGYHIHSGTTCASADDVGGHYFEGMADDPWTTNYESDSVGVSQTSLSLDDFTLDGAYPVAGRVVVIHAADGTRVGCGVLEDAVYASIGPYPGYARMQSATLGPYPGYDGDLAVAGSVMVMQTDAGIELTGTLGGLEASATGGFHIHSGTTCASADDAGATTTRAWPTIRGRRTTTATPGDASVSSRSTTHDLRRLPRRGPRRRRHAEDGTLIACASSPTSRATPWSLRPAATSPCPSPSPTGPRSRRGRRAHPLRHDLRERRRRRRHYFEGMADDPWTTTYDAYDSTTAGAATFDVAGGFTLSGDSVEGRAFVVHDEGGARVGCGVLSELSPTAAPSQLPTPAPTALGDPTPTRAPTALNPGWVGTYFAELAPYPGTSVRALRFGPKTIP